MTRFLAGGLLLAAVAVHPSISVAETTICGDHDASGSVGASDALRVLRFAVGQQAPLDCPAICSLPTCGDTLCEDSEACTTCASDCGACTGCTGAGEATTALDSAEQAFLSLLNEYRAETGAGALTNCRSLSRSAQGHAEDMRDQNYFSTFGKDGSTTYERACSACFELACSPQVLFAEVIGGGYATAQALLDGLTDEADENNILVDPDMKRVGLGHATGGGAYGTYWVIDLAGAGESSCN